MVEASTGGVADRAEQALIARLAAPEEGERSWEAIARMRRLSKVLDTIVRRETPKAIVDAREAGVTTDELKDAWGVTSTWIYKLSPARAQKPK